MMKKITSLFLILTACMLTWANPVTQEQALQSAVRFLSGNRHHAMPRNSSSLTLAQTKSMATDNTLPCYYVFNVGTDGGFVIVSGDDRTAPVLGYSTSGSFRTDDMPDNMRVWLEGYQRQMEWLASHHTDGSSNMIARPAGQSRQPISPLMTTTWDQGDPYNGQCPIYSGEHCVTGCVATAMAQVLYYHRYPEHMLKDIPSYQSNTSITVPTVGATYIDWNNMLPSYNGNETQEQKDAVASLMLMCGASVSMNYGTGASNAYSENIASALRNYFGYDGAATLESRNDYSYEEWHNMIYNELAEGRPVLYSGLSAGGGHQFVIDGYSYGDFFHVNWGWGGYRDNYFLLSILNPGSNSGIGASSSTDGYSFGQDAVIGVKPDAGGTTISVMTTESISVSKTTFFRTSESANFNNVSVTCSMYNYTGESATFDVGLGVFDASNSMIYTQASYSNNTLDNTWGWPEINLSCNFGANLPDGTYKLAPVSRISGTTEWYANKGYLNNHVTATIAGNTLTLNAPKVSLSGTMNIVGTAEIGKEIQVVASITNSGTDFNGDLLLYDGSNKIGGRHLELAAGATTEMELSFTPTTTGSHTLRLTYNEKDIAMAVVNVEPAKAYDISGEVNVTNSYTWMTIRGTTMKLTATLTNNSPYPYEDIVSCYLYKLNPDTNLGSYVKDDTKQVTIDRGETVTINFQFNDLQVGGQYFCYVYYRSEGKDAVVDGTWSYTIEQDDTPQQEPVLSVTGINVAGDRIQGSEQQLAVRIKNSGADFQGTVSLNYMAGSDSHIHTVSYEETITTGSEKQHTVPVTFTNSGTVRIWVTTSIDQQQELGSTTVTITPAATLTAQSYTREYGDENPVFDFTANKGGYSGTPTITCEATATSPAGTYPIVITQGTVDNEYVTLVNGTLTITKAPLTISAGHYTKKQGDPMPQWQAQYSGFKNGETESVLIRLPQFTCTATEASAPGTYRVTVSDAEAQNYEISYQPGTLTVTEADLIIVTVNSASRLYGDTNPTFTYSASSRALKGVPEITCEATPQSPVGTYDIIASLGTITSYNVQFVNGKLTVEKAPLTVIANNQTMEEGSPLPELTVRYEGFKLQDDESVLTILPTVATTYTPQSGPGQYPIIVSGGEAINYILAYQEGVLTVTEQSGIDNVQTDGQVVCRQANGVITITGINTHETVIVYDLNGNTIARLQANGAGEAVIALTEYPIGIYAIKIGNRKAIKIQKR